MKFWQKAFFSILILFLIGFDFMGYFIVKKSYAMNQEYVFTSVSAEYKTVKEEFEKKLVQTEGQFAQRNPENLKLSIAPQAEYYEKLGIHFALYQGDTLVYLNFPFEWTKENADFVLETEKTFVKMQEVKDTLYCFVASSLNDPYQNLKLIYVKDVQAFSLFKTQMIQSFSQISIVVSLILAVIILLLLISLTRPFRKLNTAATEISQGNYKKRVQIQSKDEIGDFAKSFNLMAEHIEEHIDTLARMSEEKQEFIDNLTHEIRTPITAIVGYGELLKYANCDKTDKEKALNHIISQGKRIQQMTQKLTSLTYAQNETIQLVPIELTELLPEVKAALDFYTEEKGVAIHTEVQPVSILGDAQLLTSLLVNLLRNAVQASPRGSMVKLACGLEKGQAWIEITDSGTGIEEKEIEKIMEPFYRVDKSRSRKEGEDGMGLGLALCSKICQLHHATLEISSELHRGTKVIILFTTLQ